ncbi:MAG: hypothetical protein QW123_00655 [Desulfurococcaceae archaeon]
MTFSSSKVERHARPRRSPGFKEKLEASKPLSFYEVDPGVACTG